MDVKKLTRLGMLTALALIIFVVELHFPDILPLPGMKLGLANIITVWAVYSYTGGEVAMLLLARILLGSLFSGNMMSLIYSISGGALCLLGMLVLRSFIDKKHIWLCSIYGAVFHNIGQTIAAAVVLRSLSVLAYLPFLLLFGCIAGAFTGVCAQLIVNRTDINKPGEQ